jgi:hypothetical protein
MVPPTDGAAAPDWYADLLENLRLNHGPAALTFAAQGEVTLGLRHATYDADTNADLPEWLDFMAAFLADRAPAEEGSGDTELSFRACYEIAVAKFRGQGTAADSEDLIRRAVEYACSSERPDIISDTVTLVSYWGGMWASGAARTTAAEIAEANERLRAHLVTELEETDAATHPVRAATLTGALAYLHLLPKWERAEAAGRTPEPVERAAHVGVKLDEANFDASSLIDDDLIEFEDAMRYLDQLVELLPSARPYSVSSLASVFTMFAPAVSGHPLYEKVRDGLDEAVAKVEGDAAIGERCRDRAIALARAGKPLEALSEMHNAKVRRFHGDTIYGTVMAMRFIGHLYADLGLTYAAKMYACSAAILSLLHTDQNVKEQAPRALLEAVDAAHNAGCWVDAAALTELAVYTQHQFEADPWNYEKHPDLANLESNSRLELGAVRKFWSELEPLIKEALPNSGWYDRIDEALKDPENQVPLTEEEFQELAPENIDGPIFSDLGPNRLVDFSALGVRWTFTFNNDKTTVLTAEGFIASFQVLLAEVARHEPVLARLTVNIHIDVIPDAPHSVDTSPSTTTAPMSQQPSPSRTILKTSKLSACPASQQHFPYYLRSTSEHRTHSSLFSKPSSATACPTRSPSGGPTKMQPTSSPPSATNDAPRPRARHPQTVLSRSRTSPWPPPRKTDRSTTATSPSNASRSATKAPSEDGPSPSHASSPTRTAEPSSQNSAKTDGSTGRS